MRRPQARPGQIEQGRDADIDAAWQPSIERALTEGYYRQLTLVARDGIALVQSMSVTDQDYDVRISDGAAVQCACLAGRAGQPCVHRAALGLALFERELGQPLLPPDATPACRARRAYRLLPTLVSRYLEPRWRGRRGPLAPGMTRSDGLREEQLVIGAQWRDPEQEAREFRATMGRWPSWW